MGLGPTRIPWNFESGLDHLLDMKRKNPDVSVYLLLCNMADVRVLLMLLFIHLFHKTGFRLLTQGNKLLTLKVHWYNLQNDIGGSKLGLWSLVYCDSGGGFKSGYKVKVGVFTSHSTARVILWQVLSIATCGSSNDAKLDWCWSNAKLANH